MLRSIFSPPKEKSKKGYVVSAAFLGLMAFCIYYLSYSANKFKNTIDDYDAMPVNDDSNNTATCGETYPVLFPDRNGNNEVKPDFYDAMLTNANCWKGVNEVLQFWMNNSECINTIDELCNGPGMWHGYIVILGFCGILLPFTIALVSGTRTYLNNRQIEEEMQYGLSQNPNAFSYASLPDASLTISEANLPDNPTNPVP